MANGVELATAYVSLTVDGSQVNQGVRKGLSSVPAQADRVGRDSGRRMGDKMSRGIVSSVGKIAGPLAAIFATVGIGKFISGTVDEAREAQKVSAITDSIVKSTGGVAKVTAKHVGDLSNAISKKIGVDDEAIQGNANLLLTFKNVRNEVGKNNKVFDQAVGLAQDLSKAGFGSAEGAAKMLGKALNDPVKGMTALGRAGVTFTEEQKKQIKDAVKQNDLLGAQKIILAEVASQVGGVAAASATVGEKAAVAWANFKEQVGTALLPVLDKLGTWFIDKGLPALTAFFTALTGGGKKFGMLAKDMGKFAKAGKFIRDVFTAIVTFIDALTGRADPLGKVSDGMEKFARYGAAVRTVITPLVTTIVTFFDALTGRGDPLKMVADGMGGVARAGTTLRTSIQGLWSWISEKLFPALIEGQQKILPPLTKAFNDIRAAISGSTSGADVDWRKFGDVITESVIPALAWLIANVLPNIVYGVKAVIVVVQALGAAFKVLMAVVTAAGNIVLTVFSSVTNAVATMLEALSNVPGFGWAKDAAAKLRTAADSADALYEAINRIPKSKTVTVTVNQIGSAFKPGGSVFDSQVPKAPKRELGGPVRKGQPYIVGEKRPELFVPESNGRIVPRVPSGVAAAGAGGIDYYRLAGAVASEMRHLSLAVDTRQNVVESARYANGRSQL